MDHLQGSPINKYRLNKNERSNNGRVGKWCYVDAWAKSF